VHGRGLWRLIGLFTLCQLAVAQDSQKIRIVGVGTTSPLAVYSKWFEKFEKIRPDLSFVYIPSGSETGMDLVTSGTADFGTSDVALTEKQLAKARASQIATLVVAIVPVYNLPGLAHPVRFSGQALAGIYLGTIRRWNDSAIANLNPEANLPSSEIIVIHSADGRGSTYIWSDYLSKVSPEWKTKVGRGIAVEWPAGQKAEGNGNVARVVKETRNSIGYVEVAYAVRNNLVCGEVQNAAGRFVSVSSSSVTAAAAAAAINPGSNFRLSLTNAPGEDSYPIASFTWILLSENNESAIKREAVKDFLRWALNDEQYNAEPTGFTPLPKAMVEHELKAIDRIP
jgi:phosphate transport system substrate-binding protein